jgi:8-oxo-dGTP diphosphatase
MLEARAGIDYPGVSVVFFCHDDNGNFLMQKRGKNCRDEKGRWDIGAGAIKVYERIMDTLVREVEEEYGTFVFRSEFLGYRDVQRENEGIKTHWITHDFRVLVDKFHVKNGEPNKFDEIGWFRLNNLPSPVHSQLFNFLQIYKDKL